MKDHQEVRPDLVVGHSGFGSTLYLADLYDCPIINYFEYYYHSRGSDMDFRPDFKLGEMSNLRARSRNAMLLLDLETCTRGYSPTLWQRERFPDSYQHKLETIHDGIDTDLWTRVPVKFRGWGDMEIPPETRIVTYVSRGFESMRGFDIFMEVAKRVCAARDDVIFLCVGSDRVCYGGDLRNIEENSYKEHVINQGNYDLSRFIFTGTIPPIMLRDVLSMSDLHIYLTVPFVLSWSMLNALACGCTVLSSEVGPVQEFITHGENGLLADFFDIDRLSELALQVLDDPEGHRVLGNAGAELIRKKYSSEVVFPQIVELYRSVAQG